MTIFIIGAKDDFDDGVILFKQSATTAERAFTGEKVEIPPMYRLRRMDGSVPSVASTVRRGRATEGKGYYARVLPADAEATVQAIDAAIYDLAAQIVKLRKERREILVANVGRGEVITDKHWLAQPTPVSRGRL